MDEKDVLPEGTCACHPKRRPVCGDPDWGGHCVACMPYRGRYELHTPLAMFGSKEDRI